MRRLTKAILIIGAFALVSVGIVVGGGHSRRLVQIVEMDGNRQYEYKIFGKIPLEEQHPDPRLVVRPDVLTALNTVQVPPSLHLDQTVDATRTIRGAQVGYFGRLPFAGDTHQVLNYYQEHLTRTNMIDTKSVSSVGGFASNGDQVIVTIYPKTMIDGRPSKEKSLSIAVAKNARG